MPIITFRSSGIIHTAISIIALLVAFFCIGTRRLTGPRQRSRKVLHLAHTAHMCYRVSNHENRALHPRALPSHSYHNLIACWGICQKVFRKTGGLYSSYCDVDDAFPFMCSDYC